MLCNIMEVHVFQSQLNAAVPYVTDLQTVVLQGFLCHLLS